MARVSDDDLWYHQYACSMQNCKCASRKSVPNLYKIINYIPAYRRGLRTDKRGIRTDLLDSRMDVLYSPNDLTWFTNRLGWFRDWFDAIYGRADKLEPIWRDVQTGWRDSRLIWNDLRTDWHDLRGLCYMILREIKWRNWTHGRVSDSSADRLFFLPHTES